MVHRWRVAKWVDEWWYERARIPCETGSYGLEALTIVVGAALGFPGFMVVTAARVMSNLDEIHTLYLALRHRDFSLFDKAQTWQRTRDGRLVNMTPESPWEDTGEKPTHKEIVKRWASDFWTERRRLPGFAFSMGASFAGLMLGAVFHAPTLVVGIVAYGAFAIQNAPVVRNAILSLVHGTWDYLNRPQTITKERQSSTVEESAVVAEAVVAEPVVGAPAVATHAVAAPVVVEPVVADPVVAGNEAAAESPVTAAGTALVKTTLVTCVVAPLRNHGLAEIAAGHRSRASAGAGRPQRRQPLESTRGLV